MDLLTPRRSPNSALPIHTQCICAVHCQGVLLGVSTRVWPLKAPGSTLGGRLPGLSSALWRQYPCLFRRAAKLKQATRVNQQRKRAIRSGFHVLLNQPARQLLDTNAADASNSATDRFTSSTLAAFAIRRSFTFMASMSVLALFSVWCGRTSSCNNT